MIIYIASYMPYLIVAETSLACCFLFEMQQTLSTTTMTDTNRSNKRADAAILVAVMITSVLMLEADVLLFSF